MKPVARRIRRWLSRRGRTQEWLAGELEITPGALALILSGARRPSLDVAVKLESITGIRPREWTGADSPAGVGR